jgi:hypothetical protein
MFAAHGIGLDKISPNGQEFILGVEARASVSGFNILKEIGVAPHDLKRVTKLLAQWFATYEALCQKNVVKKFRDGIINDKSAAFLMS